MSISLEAMKRRVSVRGFDSAPLSLEETMALQKAFMRNALGPFGGRPRFALARPEDGLSRIGTYGVIKGGPAFIVGAVANGPFAPEDFGYCLQGVVLEATVLGLGTCWLGGTFNRGFAAKAIGAKDGELLPCVTPVGRPLDRRAFMDRAIRAFAGSDGRKEASELFFAGNFSKPLSDAAAYAAVLEAVRLGPSASNKQPWRIVKRGDAFDLYLYEDKIYNAALGPNRLQDVDMGIAMMNFEAACRALSLQGSWRRLEASPLHERDPLRYIATWA